MSSTLQNTNKDVLVIMDMIARVHKSKQINEGDIVEWVAECETDYLKDIDNMIGYSGIELPVKNRRALLPCNVFRIYAIYLNRGYRGSQVPFRKVGQWLYFDKEMKADKIYIDFAGVRLDENGYPVILDGHLQALEAFCVYKLYYEDFIQQRISGSAWGFINEDMINKCRAARIDFRNYTLEDLNQMHFIQYNMVPKIGMMQLSINDVNTDLINE